MKNKSLLIFFFSLFAAFPAFAEHISKEGDGFLEKQKGQQILHLKGTPYERGYQHGVLLKEQIQRNISTYIDRVKFPVPGRLEEFSKSIPTLLPYVPQHFMEEMKGVADGSEVPLAKIVVLNLFPEMFHCSGFTVSGKASKKGELYHVRVLDYSIGKQLQSTAVLQVVEPDEGIPFLNVSYAGFIGTVTGMNLQKISIGEIGGLGYGSWKGVPMAFLLRDILQYSASLDDVKTTLQNTPRTCEYFYVFSDGKTKDSFGVYATASELDFIAPGKPHVVKAPSELQDNASGNFENTQYQTFHFDKQNRLVMLSRLQPADCLMLTGFPHPERYPVLVDRLLAGYGSIDEKDLMEVAKLPVARPSNLHTAIFLPSKLKVWVAHAGPNDEPACDQPYLEWDFRSLLSSSG
jgi:isopenicillin-N N-acyltransferase like protein